MVLATYSFTIFPRDTASFTTYGNVSDPLTNDLYGQGWQHASNWNAATPAKMAISSDATSEATTVEVEDSHNDTLDDDDFNSTGSFKANQTLTSDLTINGTTYPAGTSLEDEYEADMIDESTGITYRLVAISASTISEWGYISSTTIIGYTWEGDWPPEGATLTYVFGSSQDSQSMVPCFTAGTLIDTPDGAVRIETLKVGDLVTTGNGPRAIRWIGQRRLEASVLDSAENLRPIRIAAGALGNGMPETDLLVSPQHRMLLRSAITERMAGTREVLVAAKHLLGLPGITQDDARDVTYVHLLFDGHEILRANGAEAESLYLGEQALLALGPEARREIGTLFPALLTGTATVFEPARKMLSGRMGRAMAARHFRNAKALVEAVA